MISNDIYNVSQSTKVCRGSGDRNACFQRAGRVVQALHKRVDTRGYKSLIHVADDHLAKQTCRGICVTNSIQHRCGEVKHRYCRWDG